MASVFSTIPVRVNGTTFYASWVNDIRTALINAFGVIVTAEAQATLADNQASAANVLGLVFDKTITNSVRVDYTIYRTNGSTTERRETGYLTLTFKPIANAWTLSRRIENDEDALNKTFPSLTVTAAGQVQYISDSVGGTYIGTIRFKSVINFAKET